MVYNEKLFYDLIIVGVATGFLAAAIYWNGCKINN